MCVCYFMWHNAHESTIMLASAIVASPYQGFSELDLPGLLSLLSANEAEVIFLFFLDDATRGGLCCLSSWSCVL